MTSRPMRLLGLLIVLGSIALGSERFCSVQAAEPPAKNAAQVVAVDEQKILSGIKVPAGFEATLFAAPPDAGYPTCVAASPTGAVFVAIDENGSIDAKADRGRVIRCVDTDGDNRADLFTTFAKMDSPRGMFFDNGVLYVQHPPFVTAFFDENDDGVSDRSEVLVKGLGFDLKFRGADHTTNGLRCGIDGWMYIAVGDYGFLKAEGKDGTQQQMHGGGVVRVRTDGSGLEIVSHGQRNIYDVAVDPLLNCFTRDNTNDGGGWNVRLSHVIQNGQYGYPRLFINFPNEIIQPLADYGGGSPCGSLYLQEPGLPGEFGDALYTCDWGRNIIYRHPLTPNGAGFKAGQEEFIKVLRPTDMDVDGQSRLYISSWKDGSYTYSGPNVGFVVCVQPIDGKRPAFPNLKTATNEELLAHLASPSHVCRTHTQREILRRGDQTVLAAGLEKLAASNEPLSVRVAAIFTLGQLSGAKSHEAILRLAGKDELREFALRSLTDDIRTLTELPTTPFVEALSDKNARVRFQAATALGRLNKPEVAASLLPLTADSDPLVQYAAIQSLVKLRAAKACLNAIDLPNGSNTAGVLRVLQSLHQADVVEGLISRLAKCESSDAKRQFLVALCRLYNREAPWDATWWGTRPDTTGPYYKPVTWEQSEKIAAVLRETIAQDDAEVLRWLFVEMKRHRIDLPEAVPAILRLADRESAFRPQAITLLAGRERITEAAFKLFEEAGSSGDSAQQVMAIKALLRSFHDGHAFDQCDRVMTKSLSIEKPSPELISVRADYAQHHRQIPRVGHFAKLTAADDPQTRQLAYGVLLAQTIRKEVTKELQQIINETIEKAWKDRQSTVDLLQAIAHFRAEQSSLQVMNMQHDQRDDVRKAAKFAAAALELDDASFNSKGPQIATLPYDEAAEQAVNHKGDAKRGARLYLRQGCVVCHTVAANEVAKGPSLVDISTRYNRRELIESVLKPSSKIAQGFETQWFLMDDGRTVEGFVTRESGDEVDVRNGQGQLTTLVKKQIDERGRREQSVMPTGMCDKLTSEDLASLMKYLETLKSAK